MEMKVIARIYTGFPEKFGVPRQSGIADNPGKIVFEPEYRVREAIRGIEGYSHIWLIWMFDRAVRESWSPTVRPPRLGGNKRVGVFASRSPFRPNPIGLSCVRLEGTDFTSAEGPVLYVRGADIVDGTPILDIKPYLPFADSYPDAAGGYSDGVKGYSLKVVIPVELEKEISPEVRSSLESILAHDPRPSYQDDPDREYGLDYRGLGVKFRVEGDTLTVTEIVKKSQAPF